LIYNFTVNSGIFFTVSFAWELLHKSYEAPGNILKLNIQNIEVFPPKEKAVKKIKDFFVKKTLLSERSEFKVFRKKVQFSGFLL
jgi:hypothetical protein